MGLIMGQFVSPFNNHISEGSGFFFKFRVKFFATACGLGWLRLVLAVAKGGPGFLFQMVDSGGVECAFMVGHERIYKKKQAHSRPSHFEFPCMLTRLDYRVLFISQLCSKPKWTSVPLFRDTTIMPSRQVNNFNFQTKQMKLFQQWSNLDESLRASAKRSGHHQLFCGFNTNLHEEETGLAFCVAVLAQITDSLELLGS